MSDEDMIATTVRLPQSQIDALDAMSEEDEIPNRSEGIRASIGFALDSDEFDVPDAANKIAKFQRTKRLSKVTFYREGFASMVRDVLGAVAETSPPWPPDTVAGAMPEIFDEQIKTLFDSEERRKQAHATIEREVSKYRDAWDDAAPEQGENPYVEAFHDETEDRGDDWRPTWQPEVADLASDAMRMFDDGTSAEATEERLKSRKNVDSDLASTAVSEALSGYEGEVEQAEVGSSPDVDPGDDMADLVDAARHYHADHQDAGEDSQIRLIRNGLVVGHDIDPDRAIEAAERVVSDDRDDEDDEQDQQAQEATADD